MRSYKTLAFFIITSILLVSEPNLAGAKTWLGSTNSDWLNPANWNPSTSPNHNDDIIIPENSSGIYPLISNSFFNISTLKIQDGASLTLSGGSLIIEKKITLEDGATFTQTGGIVSTEDMELKNGSAYNQLQGEFQISHDLKVPTGNTFNGIGGTVRITGNQGGGADYTGNVQFHNVIIEADGKLKMDKDNDNIKISGNFYNNNPDLENKKGSVTFNGDATQTIYSASTPAGSKTTFGNLVITNLSGVNLESDLGIKSSINFSSGGFLIPNNNTIYLNGNLYNGPLPVELSSFSATKSESGIKLNWRTETEVNNYGFEIFRSNHNDDWSRVGFVQGHGNSNSPKEYSFYDENLSAGKYSYKLKQLDTDGKFEFSKIIEIEFGSPQVFNLSQNYPNPFNPSTTIEYSVSEQSLINLTIYNSLGEKIKELVNEEKAPGVYIVEFNGQDLSSGTYIYRIQSGNYVSTKKMILIK